MGIYVSQQIYDAGVEFKHLLETEAPKLCQALLEYDPANNPHINFDGKPQWMPFPNIFTPQGHLYSPLLKQVCERRGIDKGDSAWVSTVAAELGKGFVVDINPFTRK